jgi:hypothetical protein
MTYKGDFSEQQFGDFLKQQNDTKENFLAFTHKDFATYQCDGPIKNLVNGGVRIHNVLTYWDGTQLDAFDLTQCP